MPLLVLNEPVSTCAKLTMVLMSYQIALPVMYRRKIDEMLAYYESKGGKIISLNDFITSGY